MDISSNPMGEFFEKIGQRVIRSRSSLWHEVQSRVLLSFPYYKLIDPLDDEIEELFTQYKLRAIRYPAPPNAFGFPSTVELNTNCEYDLDCLHSTARRQTRQGLENCVVKQIEFDFLAERGLALNIDTADRQKRESLLADADYWRRYYQAAKDTPGFVAWGAMVGDELGSYLIGVTFDGWLNCLQSNSSSALLDKRPSNALLFEVTRRYLRDVPGTRICYGIGSLEHLPELDRFKVRMGWELKPIKQRIVLSKTMRRVFSLAKEPLLKVLDKVSPRNYTYRKAAGMIRLYRSQTFDVPQTESREGD
jgi:hypothetical protein